MKRWQITVLLILMVIMLAGCLYPKDRLQQNQISTGEYMILVQNAVETYKERTGVLPIKNSTEETPIYEKYLVDFKKLLDRNVISRIPADAYEAGGSNYYVIVDPEGELKVKLMDLVIAGQVSDIQRRSDSYVAEGNDLPLGELVKPSFYHVDFERLGLKSEQVRSVYSEMFLPILIHQSGRITVDYAPEIMRAITMKENSSPDPNIDLRTYLVEQSNYIPVNSYPYYWKDNEPVISE
ncbi:MAG: hypothetical protein WD424_08615 [Paenibacillaceae bacterium]